MSIFELIESSTHVNYSQITASLGVPNFLIKYRLKIKTFQGGYNTAIEIHLHSQILKRVRYFTLENH